MNPATSAEKALNVGSVKQSEKPSRMHRSECGRLVRWRIGVTPLIGSCLGNTNAPPISSSFLMGAPKNAQLSFDPLSFGNIRRNYIAFKHS